MTVQHDAYLSNRTFGALDGLRALSVLAVIWQHTSGRPGPEFFSKGYFGVDFFFAISGFLITTLLLRERRRDGRYSLRKFYARRFFRIFPVYYAVLLVYVVLVPLTRHSAPESRQFFDNLPAFLTYTSNWFVDLSHGQSVTFYFAWSLATEEQFYIFWPPLLALLLLIRPRGVTHILGALALLIAVSQFATVMAPTSLMATILASLALPILLGVMGAVVLDDAHGFRLLAPILGTKWFAPVIFVLVLASLVITTPQQLTQILMVVAVMSVCVSEQTVLHPALKVRPLAYVGVISYGMYLMHMLSANLVRLMLGHSFGILLFATTVMLTVVAASVSFRFFESPVLRVGRRFGNSETSDAVARLGRLGGGPRLAGSLATSRSEPKPEP